jgi:hypothetical protein
MRTNHFHESAASPARLTRHSNHAAVRDPPDLTPSPERGSRPSFSILSTDPPRIKSLNSRKSNGLRPKKLHPGLRRIESKKRTIIPGDTFQPIATAARRRLPRIFIALAHANGPNAHPLISRRFTLSRAPAPPRFRNCRRRYERPKPCENSRQNSLYRQ